MEIATHIRTDPEAGARRLLDEFGPGLYALALRLCGNRADADDLYLRTLERAVERIAERRGPAFGAWLRAIRLNLRRSDLRRLEAAREALPDGADGPGVDPQPAREDRMALRGPPRAPRSLRDRRQVPGSRSVTGGGVPPLRRRTRRREADSL